MKEYLLGLNEKQREAVLDTEGYVLVFAGAGSGKTKVLTTRITHLVNGLGVNPSNVLAITFTNKAADEMKERLSKMINGVDSMWVSTIHSMCVRILRSAISRLGGTYNSNFSIYSEIDKTNVLKRIVADMKIGEDKEREKYVKNAKYYISDCKNNDISPDVFRLRTDVKDVGTYTKIFYEYDEALRKANALDFDDLLVKTYHLLAADTDVLEYYSDRFQYIHVDEFQDTNVIQLQIAKLLSSKHKNLFVVGDDDQSIYSWRGAEIKNILEFGRNFKGAKIHKLEQNYRSTKRILDLANTIIASNSERSPKELWTENPEGDKVEVKIAHDENEEASYTAFQIKRMIDRGASPQDFAVLMRINAISRAYEQEFVKYNIPYKIFGGFKFFERKEIKDLTAYFRVITNPLDNESLLRIINVPKRGIGEKTIQVLWEYAKKYDLSVFDGIVDCQKLDLSTGAKSKLNDFRKLINSLIMECEQKPLTEIFESVVNKTNFLSQFEADTEENYGKKMNVNEYQNAIEDFAKLNPNATLTEYLNSITLKSDTDELESGNFVTVATIHAVKGLEFPYVFVCGLDENVFPVSRAENGESEMEEERRLMYVAITRAEKKLFLTRAESRFLYGTRQFTKQSLFLDELAPKLGLPKRYTHRDYVGGSSYGHRDAIDYDYDDRNYGYGSKNYGYVSTSRGGYGGSGYGGGYGGYGSGGGGKSRYSEDYGGSDYHGFDDFGGYSSYDQASKTKKTANTNKSFSQSLSRSASQKPQTSSVKYDAYRSGVRVKHLKFGEGMIIQTKGSGDNLTVDVAFNGVGIKSLSVKYAPLEIIKSDK